VLVFADPLGRRMLAGDSVALELISNNGLILCEGSPRFLAWACRFAEKGDGPAVLGFWSGALTEEIYARIPNGATITIDSDYDRTGDSYAEKIADSLRSRCRLRRL